MKKFQYLSFLATLAIGIGMISWGGVLHAQTSPSTTPSQQPQSQQPPDQTTPSSPSSAAPQSQPTPEQPPASQQTPQSQNPNNTPNTPPGANTPQSGTPGSTNPGATPNSGTTPGAASPGAATSDTQTFTGTIVKQGSKYVLQDASGKSYDIDHQPEVAKFEGKRVRVRGTLDQTGNKIMVK